MATNKTSGLGDNFYIGGYDLSGDIGAIDKVSGGPGLLDVTPIKQSAHSRIGAARTGAISFTSFFENTPSVSTPGFPASTTPVTNTNAFQVYVTITGGTLTFVFVNGVQVGTTAGTYPVPAGQTISITYSVAPTWNWFALGGEHNALKNPITSSDLIASYFRGTTIGNPGACMTSKQTNYDPTRDNEGNLTLKVDLLSNGFGVEWGRMLTAGLRTDTTATTGAFFDQAASGLVFPLAFGAQAYLQLVDLVGTNVDVSITHCATSGGAYTSLIDFGSLTSAPQAARATISNTTTVNEFLKVVTTGTFTYAIFAVTFVLNTAAGQVF